MSNLRNACVACSRVEFKYPTSLLLVSPCPCYYLSKGHANLLIVLYISIHRVFTCCPWVGACLFCVFFVCVFFWGGGLTICQSLFFVLSLH